MGAIPAHELISSVSVEPAVKSFLSGFMFNRRNFVVADVLRTSLDFRLFFAQLSLKTLDFKLSKIRHFCLNRLELLVFSMIMCVCVCVHIFILMCVL